MKIDVVDATNGNFDTGASHHSLAVDHTMIGQHEMGARPLHCFDHDSQRTEYGERPGSTHRQPLETDLPASGRDRSDLAAHQREDETKHRKR